MSSIKSLKQAFMPIIWLNCIFCMGVFEIPINRPRFFLSVFYVIIMLIGYFILFYQGMFIFQKISYDFSTFDLIVNAINIFVAVLAIILFWRKSQAINSIIKKSSIVDNTLEVLGIKKKYEKTYHNILFHMVIWIVSIIIMWTTFMLLGCYNIGYGYWFSLYRTICFCFPVIINSVVDLTFASFVRQVIYLKKKKKNTQIISRKKIAQRIEIVKIFLNPKIFIRVMSL
ncbi:uncharacterized protein LOC105835885 isoform X1 [Monomorium pharaonis]|uniref:uncharacterized protein LOC105835885 isoform X1 n=1 Tax=Monomorium pharaonis TaxID=307658 RepID=UPI001747237A|nr:uncharacterized protein LOC105835885 isoform X1 [Monomorium pharaonis]XP_028045802.2 uncharacterized protein LOC105835885 isoform X1 [Monomorium pharaonis]